MSDHGPFTAHHCAESVTAERDRPSGVLDARMCMECGGSGEHCIDRAYGGESYQDIVECPACNGDGRIEEGAQRAIAKLKAERNAAWAELERCKAERDATTQRAEMCLRTIERLKAETAKDVAALVERNAQLDATRSAIGAECVEHVELNGYIDTAKECHDWLNGEDDPSGKLHDFAEAIQIVVEQCDRQRRRANWYEAGYTAGKQKLIEHALSKQVEEIASWLDTGDARARGIADAIRDRSWRPAPTRGDAE